MELFFFFLVELKISLWGEKIENSKTEQQSMKLFKSSWLEMITAKIRHFDSNYKGHHYVK